MENRLQERRLALGLTQPQVSRRLKQTEPRADVGMVSRYEKGVCLPTADQLSALEDILQASRLELYDEYDLDLVRAVGVPNGQDLLGLLGEPNSAEGDAPVAKNERWHPSHAGKVRKCYRVSKAFAASLPRDLLEVCGYSSWQSWHDACLKRLLAEYSARRKALKRKEGKRV